MASVQFSLNTPYVGPSTALENNEAKERKLLEKTIAVQEATFQAQAQSEQSLREEIALLKAEAVGLRAHIESQDKTLLMLRMGTSALERENEQLRSEVRELTQVTQLTYEAGKILEELSKEAPKLWEIRSEEALLAAYTKGRSEHGAAMARMAIQKFSFFNGIPSFRYLDPVLKLIEKSTLIIEAKK